MVGGKGYALGLLKRWGFSVPETRIITTQVHSAYLKTIGPVLRQAQSQVSNEDLIQTGVNTLCLHEPNLVDDAHQLGKSIAVRSSAVCEDGKMSSWAGVFDSFLDVDPKEVYKHIVLVWLSSVSSRVVAYSLDSEQFVPMAVLVQPMISSHVAGTCFSADPVTGDRGVAVIEVVAGNSEKLLSGKAVPSRFEVRSGTLEVCQVSFGCHVNEEIVARVAVLGFEIQQRFGYPVDVEWAASDGQVWILQARPITTL